MFGASFNDEPEGLRKDQASRGLLCMANSGPDTNASQFYITLAPCPHLSGSHVRFGRLVSGDAALAAAEVGSRAGARGWRRTELARHNRCVRPLAPAARRRAAARRGRGGCFAERGWGQGGG